MYKKFLLSFFLVNSALACFSQRVTGANPFIADANGRPLFWGSSYVPDGSPYFFDEYKLADITVASGKLYTGIRVKINLVEFLVLYMNDKQEEMIATTPIAKIRFKVYDNLTEDIVIQTYSSGINTPDAQVYQVIDSGKISLVTRISITYRDEKRYSEAVITRHFEKKEIDYALLGTGELKKMEKGKSFLLEIFNDKKNEVAAFIEQNGLNCRNRKDFKLVFHYYNSL